MPSHYVYIPILVLCAPLIGGFTLLAILTSSLALFVISIRLGFLAVEFSGGFVLDFIKWGVAKITLGENPYKNKNLKKMNTKDIKGTINKSKKHHIKQSPTKSTLILETTKTKFHGSKNNFVSNDDYFMVSMISNNRRPSGRRARSDYYL